MKKDEIIKMAVVNEMVEEFERYARNMLKDGKLDHVFWEHGFRFEDEMSRECMKKEINLIVNNHMDADFCDWFEEKTERHGIYERGNSFEEMRDNILTTGKEIANFKYEVSPAEKDDIPPFALGYNPYQE